MKLVAGEGLFSGKEFPSVADGLKTIAEPYSFNKFFMKGQLRVATLTPEEQALLGKFSELTGMKIVDMGEFQQNDADQIADEIQKLDVTGTVDRCPLCGVALDENGVCPKCGYKK